MAPNLLKQTWTSFDPNELWLSMKAHFGEPGQYDRHSDNPNQLHLPLAGASCRIKLTFSDKGRIVAIARGPALQAGEWKRLSEKIEESILVGPMKVGRDCSFSLFRVLGSWHGERSGVQFLPPPDNAPRAPVEIADHPFIIEFPIKTSELWEITNHRRQRKHRELTLLLNVLLMGRISRQPIRSEHLWGSFFRADGAFEIKWVQQFFFAEFGDAVINDLSPPSDERIEDIEPERYYLQVGIDGKGLRVPIGLDDLICGYYALSSDDREKFDRALYWMDTSSRHWNYSASASFAALVIAVEALMPEGNTHKSY